MRKAIAAWADQAAPNHPELLRLGFFGSCARGDWGVGSDLDLIAVVSESSQPFERRSLSWSLTSLPVPADLLVYTRAEWESLLEKGGLFAVTLSRETVWVHSNLGPRFTPSPVGEIIF